MALFEVVVTRITYAETTYQINGESIEAAEVQAEREAANDDWTGRCHTVDYEVSFSSPIEEASEEEKLEDAIRRRLIDRKWIKNG